jgi:2-polyprenyl-3-methyl-5-hydroxy-6-metoxy-1,4-benzoquinol methylase
VGKWFGGDRTVEQQFTGLDQLWPRVEGKSVLDVGCAEGYIAVECEKRGAIDVVGVDVRQEAVDAALQRARNRKAAFMWADVNRWTPPGRFDVVLLLAVLHKLKQPADVLRRIIEHGCKDTATIVLRLRRKDWPVLVDMRSKYKEQDIRFVMYDHGFTLVHEDDGPVADGQPAEWCGFFERVTA